MRWLLVTLAILWIGCGRPEPTPPAIRVVGAKPAVYAVTHTPATLVVQTREWQWFSLGTYQVTAYCADCVVCETQWTTADGTRADYRKRIVAADRKVAFGTVVAIEGFEASYTVRDRGGAIRGKELDILMATHQKAKRFGRQKREVWAWRKVWVEKVVPAHTYAAGPLQGGLY
jgi:3D (Asp-Asp-Asp) domain-containing protein